MEIGILVLFVVVLAGLNAMFRTLTAPDIIKIENLCDLENVFSISTDYLSYKDMLSVIGVYVIWNNAHGDSMVVKIQKSYDVEETLRRIKKLAIQNYTNRYK